MGVAIYADGIYCPLERHVFLSFVVIHLETAQRGNMPAAAAAAKLQTGKYE